MTIPLDPAVDWVLDDPALALLDVAPDIGVLPPLPEPPVEDPDEPWVPPEPPAPSPLPPLRRIGRRTTLVACDYWTQEPITSFSSASVSSWEESWFGTVARARATVSIHDPAWHQIDPRSAPNPSGSEKWAALVQRIWWQVWEDGALVAAGFANRPTSLGEQVDLDIEFEPLDNRVLGAGGIIDLLDGRARFELPGPLDGWTVGPGVTVTSVRDAYSGDRALKVSGAGQLRSPWMSPRVVTHLVYGGAIGSALVLLRGEGTVTVHVETAGVAGSPPVLAGLADWNLDQQRAADVGVRDWQMIEAPGRYQAIDGWHTARVVIGVMTDDAVIDHVRLTRSGWTGRFRGQPTDLAGYPAMILRDAQSAQSGGDIGVRVQRWDSTGTSAQMAWEHTRDVTVAQALAEVAEQIGGPDLWWTPDRTLHVASRRGVDHEHLALNDHNVVSASVTVDPGARVEELRVLTGDGAGPSRVALGFDRPRVGSPAVRPARRRLLVAGDHQSYQSAEAWARGQSDWLSYTPVEAEVVVDADLGRRVRVGDALRCSFSRGGIGVERWLRCSHRRVDVAAETVTLTLGTDEVRRG